MKLTEEQKQMKTDKKISNCCYENEDCPICPTRTPQVQKSISGILKHTTIAGFSVKKIKQALLASILSWEELKDEDENSIPESDHSLLLLVEMRQRNNQRKQIRNRLTKEFGRG